jgi:hypothetical protein
LLTIMEQHRQKTIKLFYKTETLICWITIHFDQTYFQNGLFLFIVKCSLRGIFDQTLF